MIVCSCNVFSDNEIRRALASGVRPPRLVDLGELLLAAAAFDADDIA